MTSGKPLSEESQLARYKRYVRYIRFRTAETVDVTIRTVLFLPLTLAHDSPPATTPDRHVAVMH